MKKLLSLISLLLMLAALTACSRGTPSAHAQEDLNQDPNVIMTTVYPIYDASCQSVTIVIENRGEETLLFGQDWSLEQRRGNRWIALDIRGGFEDIAYHLENGQRRYQQCYISSLKAGQYRIVKEINDMYFTAEFEIGTSSITAEAPYGLVPLESIPQGYTAEAAAADGAVVLRGGQAVNGELIPAFFNEWHWPMFRGQLRVAVETDTGLMLTDLIYENDHGRITCRTADRRTDASTTDVTTSYYSFAHVQNGGIVLSNHADSGDYGENIFLFSLPQELLDAIEPYVDLGDPRHVLQAWSPDGTTYAFLNEKGDTCLNTSGRSSGFVGEFSDKKILEFVWADNSTLMVMAKADEAGTAYFYEFIRVNDINDIQTVSYTTSPYRYKISNGEIIIPE